MLEVYALTQDYECYDNNNHNNLAEFVYLHGKLHDKNDFDLCCIDDLPNKDGKYSCKVIYIDGTIELGCTLYFWHSESPYAKRCPAAFQHGLIVSDSDYNAVSYAEECYTKKVNQV